MIGAEALPHVSASLNAISASLLIAALVAIRNGRRLLHARLMLGNLTASVLFVVCYVLQTLLLGHQRFPGDDWVRTLFLTLLFTHTFLAVVLVPLVGRTLYLALKQRFAEHRRIARVTYPIWLYVSATGVLFYWMIRHLRPPA
jgi:uncharacterized membrane protein YozB (DUF420 family)